MNSQLLDEARKLSVEERLELVEAIWDSIAERGAALPLSSQQEAELDRRLADHQAHPDEAIPWSEVKEEALNRLKR